MAVHTHNWNQLLTGTGTASDPEDGSNVQTLTIKQPVWSADQIIFAQVFVSNTSSATVPMPSLSDNQNLQWNVLANVQWDGTNASRHVLFWARTNMRGRCIVTVDAGASVSMLTLALWVEEGVDVIAPLDPHADSLKSATWTANTAGSVSGFSTQEPDTIVYALYGGRLTNDPGAVSGFSNLWQTANRVRSRRKVITSAESNVTYSFANTLSHGSMIALALRPRRQAVKQIRCMHSFDGRPGITTTNSGFSAGASNGEFTMSTAGTGTGSWSQTTGRKGTTNGAVRLLGPPTTANITRLRYINLGSFGVTGGNTSFGQGFGNVLDGEHVYIGMNVKVGSVLGSSAAGEHYVCGFQQSTTSVRAILTFDIDSGNRHWRLYSGGNPNNGAPDGTLLQTKKPGFDPFNEWVWLEIHLYRHASQGKIEVWQERKNVMPGPGPWHLGILPSPDAWGITESYKMEKVIDYTGDTSVATMGVINEFIMCASRTASNNNIACDFDDLVFSTGDRMREPCYVHEVYPTSDVATSVWTPSTGSDHYAVVNQNPYSASESLGATTGNPRDVFAFSGGLGYTPKKVFGVQVAGSAFRSGGSGLSWRCNAISNGVEAQGFYDTPSTVLHYWLTSCVEKDPNTRVGWSYAGAVAVQAALEIPAVNNNFDAQSISSGTFTSYQVTKKILATIEHGNGEGGDGPGTPIDVDPFYNTGMHPIARGIASAKGNLHPVDVGISQ